MADINAAFVEQVLDIAQRERESDIQHHRQADDFLAGLEILEWIAFCHTGRLGRRQRRLNPVSFDNARFGVLRISYIPQEPDSGLKGKPLTRHARPLHLGVIEYPGMADRMSLEHAISCYGMCSSR
jgi:hypothetical protein